jgi:hypothetical protein
MEMIIIVVVLCLIVVWFMSGGNSGGGSSRMPHKMSEKISDKDVDVLTVLSHLDSFKPSNRSSHKNGFSERDVHDELEAHLKNIYYSVTREHAIEGKNVKRIDFDLGNGMVGLEIKLAESVLHESENDRLIGQALKYAGRKYNSGNLIIALAGHEHHTRNTIIHEVQMDIERSGAHFVFLKAKPIKK